MGAQNFNFVFKCALNEKGEGFQPHILHFWATIFRQDYPTSTIFHQPKSPLYSSPVTTPLVINDGQIFTLR